MPECPVPLLGRDLLTKFQTLVQFGDPLREGTHQEKRLLLATGACLSHTSEEISLPPHIVSQVSPSFWDTEVPGRATNVPSVQISLKPNADYLWNKQYPLRSKAQRGIQPLITKFLKYGLLRTCQSPCNNPILPIKKSKVENTSLFKT